MAHSEHEDVSFLGDVDDDMRLVAIDADGWCEFVAQSSDLWVQFDGVAGGLEPLRVGFGLRRAKRSIP